MMRKTEAIRTRPIAFRATYGFLHGILWRSHCEGQPRGQKDWELEMDHGFMDYTLGCQS